MKTKLLILLAIIFTYSYASSQVGENPTENIWKSIDFDFQAEINGTNETGPKCISIVDEQIAWMTFADYGNRIGTAPTYRKIGITSDAGETWKIIQGPGDQNSMYSNICGIDTKTAWIPVNTSQSGLYKTFDEGVHWQKISGIFDSPGSLCNFVYFWDKDNGFAQGDPVNISQGGEFEMYRTKDGGLNWLKIPGYIANKNEGGATDFYDVSEEGVLYWQTSQGRVFKTTDKGESFTFSESGLTNTFYAQGLKVLDSETVIIPKFDPVAKKYTYKITENSGQTWRDWKPLGENETFGLTYFCSVPGTEALISVSSESASTGTTSNFISYCPDGKKGEEWFLFPQWTEEYQDKANAVYVNFDRKNSNIIGYAGSFNYGSEDPRLDGILTYKGDLPDITASIDYLLKGNINIYPNPASDILYISNKEKIETAKVYNILGKEVKKINPNRTNCTLSVNDLEKGIYIISVRTENNKEFLQKIVIK